MKKTVDELRRNAIRWWPVEIVDTARTVSPMSLIKDSHQEFLETVSKLPQDPASIREALTAIEMPFNLFLKHLLLLADFGGEQVERIHLDRHELFCGKDSFQVLFGGEVSEISVSCFWGSKSVTNSILKIDGKSIFTPTAANALQLDMAEIVFFGGFAVDQGTSSALHPCDLFRFVGNRNVLEEFVRTRYLDVSRIGQGAEANARGQALQIEVDHRLKELLGPEYEIQPNGKVTVEGRTMTSDLLVIHNGKAVAVEVAFQVTTNSVIERKATDAAKRKADLNSFGIASCYVLDGIGVFKRRSALTKIIDQSDLVVNFSREDAESLADFVREWCR